MKITIQFILVFLFLAGVALPSDAAFTSFYVFGDSLSAGTTSSPVGPYYYGSHKSNGRVWAEVLAQRQGLNFNLPGNTNAYFGNTSSLLVGEVKSFVPPPDASHALVAIWVNNADLYFPASDNPPTLAGFNAVINQAQTNHYNAITNLYAKGIRNLVMPNVVDISTIPAFNSNPNYTNLFHQVSMNYNAAFYATLNRARTNCPGLTIYVPDYFALLTSLLAQPASYGVTNALQSGVSIDALAALGNPSLTNGPGTNYIFWDKTDPTAKVHSIMASIAQQLISPVQISQITVLNGSNRLDVVNMPVGLSGFVDESTNLATDWTTVQGFNSTSLTQSIFVSNTNNISNTNNLSQGSGGSGTSASSSGLLGGPNPITGLWMYRVRFPFTWVWP